MPQTPTTKLVEVPGELDPNHPWLKAGWNREAIIEFLAQYDIDAKLVTTAKFTRDWFEVMVRIQDDYGQYVYAADGRDIKTVVERHPYKEGTKPKILREARARKEA